MSKNHGDNLSLHIYSILSPFNSCIQKVQIANINVVMLSGQVLNLNLTGLPAN